MTDAINRPAGDGTLTDRQLVARHLKLARHTTGDVALEAVAWARCVAPNSVPALRLEAQLLVIADQDEDADALIARGLLLRPMDPGLRTLEAGRQLEAGEDERALQTLEELLVARPHSRRVRQLVARALLKIGRTPQAIEQLNDMVTSSAGDAREALTMLVGLHLEADQIEAAERLISQLHPTPPILRARLMRARGQHLDAADYLEEMACGTYREDEAVLIGLINTLEAIGDVERLTDTLRAVDPTLAAVVLRASLSWLSLGDWPQCLATLDTLLDQPPWRRQALSIRAVALSASGAPDRAREALSVPHSRAAEADRNLFVEAWRRALLGQIVGCDSTARERPALNEASPLANLLTSATIALGSAVDSESGAHREICLVALGGPVGAEPESQVPRCRVPGPAREAIDRPELDLTGRVAA